MFGPQKYTAKPVNILTKYVHFFVFQEIPAGDQFCFLTIQDVVAILMATGWFSTNQTQALLAGKKVVVIGDSGIY